MRARLAAASLLLLLLLVPAFAQYEPPHANPGPAVDRIQFRGGISVDLAPEEIRRGTIDLYLFSLRTEAARRLLTSPDAQVFQAPATSVAIVLNPAPPLPGEINPLAFREVRVALQYVVNREFVASNIYQGLAAPMVSHVSPFDFDFLTVSEVVNRANIRYDPERASQIVNDVMTREGATLEQGRWMFDGQPVRLKFIIRVEDERRDAGDLVAAELDKLGFTVERIFQQFGQAIFTVYGSDPSVFNWHLYTEGWGRGSPERYDFGTLNQMCAPWLGNMPGWQEVGFWQYENEELDRIGQRLFTGSFANEAERSQLYQDATRLCLDESVRLWVATVVNNFPATSGLSGVTLDLVAGPRAVPTLREAFVEGRNELVVGNLWVWTERTVWNPVGGFGDVFSLDIWRNLFDPPLWRHPFTGIPQPFRATYSVETAGPTGKLDIPSDAVSWDAASKQWRAASARQATSKVTLDYSSYFQSKWHHGEAIAMADVLYGIFQQFDLTYDASKSRIEVSIATVAKPYLDTFRGFRIENDTALEVYVDYWHFVPDYIAEYASVTGVTMPWEVLAAMDDLVFKQRRAAYSDTASQRFQVPWITLVESQDARLVSLTLDDFADVGTYPEAVFTVGDRQLVSLGQARQRYQAALDWYTAKNLFVISNGPFQLTRFDPPSQFAEIEAFREPTYPFRPGHWFLGEAQPVEVVSVDAPFLLIGEEVRFTVVVQGPGTLAVRYLLYDAARGQPVTGAIGQATGGGNQFLVTLPADVTAQLEAGTYELQITAYSDAISTIAERQVLVEAGREPPQTTTTTPTGTVTTTRPPDGGQIAAPAVPTLAIAGGVAGAAVVVAAVFLLRRRRPRPAPAA